MCRLNFIICTSAHFQISKFASMKFLLIILFSLFLFSCGNDQPQTPLMRKDSVAGNDSEARKEMTQKFLAREWTDSIVANIKEKISAGKLRKREMAGGAKSLSGGRVYEYFEGDTSLVYLYSDNGLEFGSSEIECYFHHGEPIFSQRNRIKFGKNASGEVDANSRLKTATETTYFSNGKIAEQQTQTFTNEIGWKKIPFQDQLQKIINDIQADLNRQGTWKK